MLSVCIYLHKLSASVYIMNEIKFQSVELINAFKIFCSAKFSFIKSNANDVRTKLFSLTLFFSLWCSHPLLVAACVHARVSW